MVTPAEANLKLPVMGTRSVGVVHTVLAWRASDVGVWLVGVPGDSR